MSGTYSGDPSKNTKDQVRFLIGDTDTKRFLFSDKEINFLISSEGGPLQAAIAAAWQLSAKFARMCDETVGKVKKSYSQRSEAYAKLANNLKKKLTSTGAPIPFAGGISRSDKELRSEDADIVQPVFTKTLHNYDDRFQEHDNF